ncbi:hypothetical protein DITRI_Ditri19aG0088500 [Diplodiscus trichospermus]
MERRICFKELVCVGNSEVEIQMGRVNAGRHQRCLKAIRIQPSDREIVFLKIDGNVVSCNLETRELKIDATIHDQLLAILAFPVELQWWPTPIPALPRRVKLQ